MAHWGRARCYGEAARSQLDFFFAYISLWYGTCRTFLMKRGIWPSPHDGHLCLLQKIWGKKKTEVLCEETLRRGSKTSTKWSPWHRFIQAGKKKRPEINVNLKDSAQVKCYFTLCSIKNMTSHCGEQQCYMKPTVVQWFLWVTRLENLLSDG